MPNQNQDKRSSSSDKESMDRIREGGRKGGEHSHSGGRSSDEDQNNTQRTSQQNRNRDDDEETNDTNENESRSGLSDKEAMDRIREGGRKGGENSHQND